MSDLPRTDQIAVAAARAAAWRLVPPSVFRAAITSVDAEPASNGEPLYRVAYMLGGRYGVVRFIGTSATPIAGNDWRACREAFLVIACAVGIAALAVAFVRAGYDGQHAWYSAFGHGRLVGVFGVLALLAAGRAAYGCLLPWRVWTLASTWIPGAIALALALATTIICHVGGPSAQHALAALQSGDEKQAQLEADALITQQLDVRGGQRVLDALHLRHLQHMQSAAQISSSLSDRWYGDDARAAGVSWLDDRARREARESYANGNSSNLDLLANNVRPYDSQVAAQVEALAHLSRARGCAAVVSFPCAQSEMGSAQPDASAEDFTRARDEVVAAARNELQRLAATKPPVNDPRASKGRLTSMLDAASCASELSGTPSQPSVDELKAQLAPVEQAVEAIEKREAAAAEAQRRQQEAIAAQRRAQDQAAQRIREAQEHEASRLVLCNDGTTSGCMCHAPSHRGCCSHHSGIAGCAP